MISYISGKNLEQHNSFKIYNASAGSGKTYTLVKEYLLLLLGSRRQDAYKSILAITFTNKAVGELKSRIIQNLHSLSKTNLSNKEQALLKDISASLQLPEASIQAKSRDLLKNIIHNYASFEVSTIDGFTHRVLRTFARDLGLPLNFEVELRTDEVLNEAVDRLISKAGRDRALTKILVSFVLSKTDDDKSWDIARDLFSIAKLLTRETSQEFLEILQSSEIGDFKILAEEIRRQQQDLERGIVELSQTFFKLLDENLLDNSCFSGAYCPKFFLKLQKGDFNVKFSAGWQVNLAETPLYSKSVAPDKKATLDQLQPQIVQLYEQAKNGITR